MNVPISFPTPLRDTSRVLNIGFLCPHNSYDRRTFSGTAFFSARALAARPGIRLRRLGNHCSPGILDRLSRRESPHTRYEDCDFSGLDCVVGMVASPLLDKLATAIPSMPFVHVTDATPAFLRESYGWNVPEQADIVERRVAGSAMATVYSSEVIARRAIRDLRLPGLAASVQPFGTNLDRWPKAISDKPALTPLKLLFVGNHWSRKRGDLAVAVLDALLERGHSAELAIVGRCPAACRSHPAIRDMGYLNKNRARDAKIMARLYGEAHILILPSRADCTPMVVAEAMAHGTPVLSTDVGGIPSQIGQGAGRTLPVTAPAEIWANTIEEMTRDEDNYRHLSDAAFDRASSYFTWDVWASGIEHLVRAGLAAGEPLTNARATGT